MVNTVAHNCQVKPIQKGRKTIPSKIFEVLFAIGSYNRLSSRNRVSNSVSERRSRSSFFSPI